MEATTIESVEYTAKDVAAHNQPGDLWIVVHGEVFDVSTYIHDHPGGADVFTEIAGADGSEAFDNAQHSEDALNIKADFRVGRLKDEGLTQVLKVVRLIDPAAAPTSSKKQRSRAILALSIGFSSSIAGLGAWWGATRLDIASFLRRPWTTIAWRRGDRKGLGFTGGVLLTSGLVLLTMGFAVRHVLAKMKLWRDQFRLQPHLKMPRVARPDVLNRRGWLEPAVFQKLPLTKKELLGPNTYRFLFALPKSDSVLGLPIGQHVSIRASVDGKVISRSYTPTSNNTDRGILELIVRCYDNGIFTNRYLKKLEIGDEVEFRGPKGAIRYERGLCEKIGMVAGGTGITPMYQLIRAICENPRDTTEISLVYANRTEQDILLRNELDRFARRYPRNFKVFYVLDHPPAGWEGGHGFVNQEILQDRFGPPSTTVKIFVCGPPPMVESVKRSLGTVGFQQPGAITKLSDSVLCF